jgi:hypothetical protein
MVCRFPTTDFLSNAALTILDSAPPMPPCCFEELESVAFWCGMQDGPETIRSDAFARAVSILFGFVPTASLPNERLECIRRLTVCLNHNLADQALVEARRARRHGVAAEQIISLVGSFHGPATGSACIAL